MMVGMVRYRPSIGDADHGARRNAITTSAMRRFSCHYADAITIFTSMKPESGDLSDFLQPTPVIDSDAPAIRNKALELTTSLKNEVDQARALLSGYGIPSPTPGISKAAK
jgi:hypothetical protein